MVSIVFALLASAVVAKAWLTLSTPQDPSDSSDSDVATYSSGPVSEPLHVPPSATYAYSAPSADFYPELNFALDVPQLISNLPPVLPGDPQASDDSDWLDSGLPVHDSIMSPQVSSGGSGSGGEEVASVISSQLSFGAAQFSSALPNFGVGNLVVPSTVPAVVVAQSVPDPDRMSLVAIGLGLLLLSRKFRWLSRA